MKVLEESTAVSLRGLVSDNGLLAMMPKTYAVRQKQINLTRQN